VVNLAASGAMAEVGIDIATNSPKHWTDELVRAGVVITMGCGDACCFFPGKRYEDWQLGDPAGRSIEDVRPSETTSAPASIISSKRWRVTATDLAHDMTAGRLSPTASPR
jgi:protein-tyrosine-phosphatase